MDYSARFIFLTAPTIEELKRRLQMNDSISEEKVKAIFESAKDDIKHSEIEGLYEKVIVNDNLTNSLEELERTLFGKRAEDGLPDASGEEAVATTEAIEEVDE